MKIKKFYLYCVINKMYQNPINEQLVQKIDMMDRRKVRNMEAIDEGAGYSGGASVSGRTIGGKRGRPKKMKGEGILESIGGLVDGFLGFGAKQRGQKKYKKQSEDMYACGGSGFARGTHMDTGFDYTEGAGFSGGQKEEILKMFFSKGRAKKMKEKLEGAGFWSDFADGFQKGFLGTLDVATKALPIVAPFIGLGKSGGNFYETLRKMKNPDIVMPIMRSGGRKTTRTDLEQMGKYVPDKAVEQSQMLGSDMSGMGKRKMKCSCEGMGYSGGADRLPAEMPMPKPMPNVFTQLMKREMGQVRNIMPPPSSPPRQVRRLEPPPAPKRRRTGMGSSGGRRTEESGDFSGGFAGMGSSGGKKPMNAWLKLVNQVRQEQGFKGIKEAIAYIKQHNLYKK
jgi:hypothetical protein